MTARRIAVYALLLVAALLILLFVLAPYPAHAQEFRAADQIYLPAAIHIGQWTTDVTIANETDDPVSVNVRYVQANTAPVLVEKRDVIRLVPRENRDIIDLLGSLGLSGMGQLVFSACLDGADCSDGALGAKSNYRNISVQSRIYSRTANGGTSGQSMPGLAWWAYGNRNYPLKIVGLRVGPQYRTNIGLVNMSEHAGVWLLVSLYDGPSHAVRDRARAHLAPMESRQQPVTELFPLLGNWSRLNRTRTTASAYITVELLSSESAGGGVPADCSDAYVAFAAYGSLIDNVSGGATTLEATFAGELGGLNDGQVAVLFGAPFNTTPQSQLDWCAEITASGVAPQASQVQMQVLSAPVVHRRIEKE